MNVIFGDKLRELRRDRHLTQKQLASILHVSKTSICQWETHKQECSFEDLVNIATYFDVSSDYLLGLSLDY